GTLFWKQGDDGRPGYNNRPGCKIYHQKWLDALPILPATVTHSAKGTMSEGVDIWLDSPKVNAKEPATLRHYRRWAERFRSEFGSAPYAVFDDKRIRREVISWLDQWSHAPRQRDYGKQVAHMIVKYLSDQGLCQNHLMKIENLYSSNRAEIVWTPDLVDEWKKGQPEHMVRVMDFMTLFGPRPQDAIIANRGHIIEAEGQRFLAIRTQKRKRVATLRIAGRLAEFVDSLPTSQFLFITDKEGKGWGSVERLSRAFTAVSREKAIEKHTLYDTRGTAATSLIMDGNSVEDVALHMGWSLKHAYEVIENYVAMVPEVAVHRQIARLKAAGQMR
ncbi:MAG: hypothetical protein AAGC81_09480, partial [Pseudomonadota bacterium]